MEPMDVRALKQVIELEARVKKLEKRLAQCVAWITERVQYDAGKTAGTGRDPKGYIEKKVKAVFPD